MRNAAGTRALDVVELRDLEVRCVIGIYGHERTRTQPLVVGLELFLDLRPAGSSDEVGATIDYGRVAAEVRFLLEHARFGLIEAAAETLARWLLLPPLADAARPPLERVRVRIDKPEALRGLARPAVVLTRSRAGVAAPAITTSFGALEQVHRSSELAVERVRLAAGAELGPSCYRDADAHELTLGDGLVTQGRALPWGTALSWAPGQPHGWRNPTSGERCLLRVTRPPAVAQRADASDAGAPQPTTDYAPAGTRA